MSEDTFRVIFNGTITEEYDLVTTIKRFAKYFRISQKKAKLLFSGSEQVIKTGLTEEDAMKLAMAIATIGCECVIEQVPEDPDLSKRPGFVEQRSGEDRRQMKSRRKVVRGSSSKPDRRQNNGRRHSDKN
jgi:hypothetical protein